MHPADGLYHGCMRWPLIWHGFRNNVNAFPMQAL